MEFIIFIVVSWFLYHFLTHLAQQWASCPHGVRGGKAQNLCKFCVQEQNAIKEKNRIAAAADKLQRDETSRLDKLMLSIEELRSLSPRDFENIVARMFERMGFTVKQTPFVNDGGRDAILTKDGKKFLLECKRYKDGSVSGRPDLQKFHSAITTDDAVSGFFVTAGGFSKDAITFSKIGRIDLVDQYTSRDTAVFVSLAFQQELFSVFC
jgi:restriction endonuclease Mrr